MKEIFIIYLQPIVLKKPAEMEDIESDITSVANSFSCNINGHAFETCCNNPFRLPSLYGGYSKNFSVVRITAKNILSRPHKYVIIELNNFNGIGEYLLSDPINECRYEEFYPDNVYESTITGQGKVIITKDDRVNFILSGNFEFTAVNSTNPVDIVSVSKGEFYLKF